MPRGLDGTQTLLPVWCPCPGGSAPARAVAFSVPRQRDSEPPCPQGLVEGPREAGHGPAWTPGPACHPGAPEEPGGGPCTWHLSPMGRVPRSFLPAVTAVAGGTRTVRRGGQRNAGAFRPGRAGLRGGVSRSEAQVLWLPRPVSTKTVAAWSSPCSLPGRPRGTPVPPSGSQQGLGRALPPTERWDQAPPSTAQASPPSLGECRNQHQKWGRAQSHTAGGRPHPSTWLTPFYR